MPVAVSRLTCEHCRKKEAVQVVVVDFPKHGRIVQLVCADCGDFTVKVHSSESRSQDLVWRYAITPI